MELLQPRGLKTICVTLLNVTKDIAKVYRRVFILYDYLFYNWKRMGFLILYTDLYQVQNTAKLFHATEF